MGLRLYQAPVESDIQSKPAAEKTSAQARSSIRRGGVYRSSSLTPSQALARDRRRRLAVAAAAASSGQPFHPSVFYGDRSRSPQPDAPTPGEPSASTDGNASSTAPDNGRRALRNMAARLGVLDDQIIAVFADRWAHLHTETNPNPSRDDDDNDTSPLSIMAVEPDFLPRRRVPSVTEPYATSSIRSTQAPGHPSRSSTQAPRSYARRRYADGLRDVSRPPAPRARDQPRAVFSRPGDDFTYGTYGNRMSASFDGLGDRNRSLSPEGDNVWDTLLTTLTPDPQPPSVGSSFASASASAAASQAPATLSSRTSFAGPDTAEESFDPPCESGCENSDTEGDEDDEMEQNPLTRFPTGLRSSRRSYADVTRNVDDSPLEMLGGIGGMQRIVSNLARREDIPDEWWAEAGLSRTLSREASSS
ncbi:hypothetical protein B0T16DRAFT_415106 [Cercophora newfieldiana]|uniref:Uncharacterized protein n=1 Tax=Cercophora newfieldiana TaxID=92897 RepID=A0AA39XZ75_9PEZI|nr:hypothetical protein B0T16DRAFT_415106 [Cercophora newfieldiana]